MSQFRPFKTEGLVLMTLLTLLIAATVTKSASAKNLEERIGFGMTVLDFHNSTALSVRYFASNYFATTFIFGFDTVQGTNATALGVKLSRNLHLEENLNFFAALAGYLVSERLLGFNSSTGIEFDALLGAEFFFSGLPNLGFQFEAGLALRSMQYVRFKTIGGGLAGCAVHYYF